MEDDIDEDTNIRINVTTMPGWATEFLARQGIDIEFRLCDLTFEQKQAIALVETLISLEEKGAIKCEYDPKVDDAPRVGLTKDGLEYCKTKLGDDQTPIKRKNVSIVEVHKITNKETKRGE
jgi:hypothetical protein